LIIEHWTLKKDPHDLGFMGNEKCQVVKVDGLVRSQKTSSSVIPAEAGIQEYQEVLDPGFRRGDGFDDFLRSHQI